MEMATKTAVKGCGATYAAYGRVFRVEEAGKAGTFWAAGRARGRPVAYLDKLGPRATRVEMQAALDRWAERHASRVRS